jgi:hypothetical protein
MTTPTRYGTSCAPREDGVFVHFTEYEKVVAECDRLRLSPENQPEFIIAWLREEARKLASSFNSDVYGALLDAADQLEMLLCDEERS